MPNLNFSAPTTVDEAVRALAGAQGLAKPLSGGTDLLVQMRSGRVRPEVIVDLKRIPELIGIREEGDRFLIGASTPGAMVYENAALTKAWPGNVGSPDFNGPAQNPGAGPPPRNPVQVSPAADSVPAMIAARATAV